MPRMKCSANGKRGWKYGASGKCYTGSNAAAKADRQGRAIRASQARERKR